MQSVISKTIDTADQVAQYDACVKRLLSEKIILAWILKECVSEFKRYSILQIMKDCIEGEPDISVITVDQDDLDYSNDPDYNDSVIEGMNAEDTSITEGTVYYDIRFSAIVPDTHTPVQLIINIEAQKSDKTGYPLIKRAVYYVSRMISAQKNTVFVKSHYEKIRKVYSIWIQMNVSSKKANTITEYSISERNIVGAVKEIEINYDLMTIIMLGLGNPEKSPDEPILQLLDVLLSEEIKPEEKKKILERDFDIPMSVSMNEEANIMCNLGEGIRERAFEQAFKQAFEQAFEQATQLTQTNGVLNLMKSLKLSAEEAINAMGIPDEDKPALLDTIGKRLAEK